MRKIRWWKLFARLGPVALKRWRKPTNPVTSFPKADPAVIPSAQNSPFSAFCARIEKTFSRTVLCVVWAAIFQGLFLVYLPSLKGPFIYDDLEAITSNADLRHPEEPWRVFGDHKASLQYDRRPVAGLVTLVDYQLWGQKAHGYKITNLFIHIACGMALAALVASVSALFGGRFPLLFGHFVAIVWMFHPLSTSTVSFVFQRAEMLMSLFFLLSLYCLMRSTKGERSRKWQAAVLGCAILSALSKEVGLTLVIAIPVFARICLFETWREVFAKIGRMLILLLLIFCGLTLWVRSGVRFAELNQPDNSLSHSWEYFKYQCLVLVRYLKLTVFPYPLVFLPDFRKVPSFLECIPYGLLLLATGGMVARAGLRKPWLWLCLAGVLIVLAPTSSFIPIPLEPEIEFRMYLPLAFVLAGLLSWAGKRALETQKHSGIVVGLIVSLFVAGAAATAVRNQTYSNAVSLWADTVEKAPTNAKSWVNLGFCYLAAGELDKAADCGQRLVYWGSQKGGDKLAASGFQILGLIELQRGNSAKALEIFEHLFSENPESLGIQLGMAHALAVTGDPQAGLNLLKKYHPDPFNSSPAVALLYGSILKTLGNVGEEVEFTARLNRVFPGARIETLLKPGRVTEAVTSDPDSFPSSSK